MVNKAHHLFYHLLKKNFLKFCLFSINLCKFALVNHVRSHRGRKQTQPTACMTMQKPAEGGMSCSWGAAWRWGTIYGLGVYLTLCSWRLETSQTFIVVRNEATVDVHGCVITSRRYTLLYIRYAKGAIYIQAWASALLVQLRWAMRRPPSVGRVMVWLPRFFRRYHNLKILINH